MVYYVARMFRQKTICKHDKATYCSFLMRQSLRTPQGPRSRTICNVSHLPPPIRGLIAQALQGKALVDLETLELSEAQSFGGLGIGLNVASI